MKYFPALAVVLLLLIAFTISFLDKSNAERFVDYLLQNNYLDSKHVSIVENSIEFMLASHTSKLQMQVNGAIKRNAVNLYLINHPLKENAPEHLQQYVGQIAYVGEHNIVLVDMEKVKSLASINNNAWKDISTYTGENLEYPTNPYAKKDNSAEVKSIEFILTWIVGHEIGHVLAKHPESHFEQATIEQSKFSSEAIKKEHEADALFARGIEYAVSEGIWGREDVERLSENLISYMEKQHQLELGDTTMYGPWAFLSQVPKKSSTATTHAEYFIRAGRVLTLIDHYYTDIFKEQVPKLEEVYYKLTVQDGGKLNVTGYPAHTRVEFIGVEDRGTLGVPFSVWIAPSSYKVIASAPGFSTQTLNLTLRPASIEDLHIELIKLPNYPHAAQQKLDEIDNAEYHSLQAESFVLDWNNQANLAAAKFELIQAVSNKRQWANPHFKLAAIAAEQLNCKEAAQHWRDGLAGVFTSDPLDFYINFYAEPELELLDYDLQNDTDGTASVALKMLKWYMDSNNPAAAQQIAARNLSGQNGTRIQEYFKALLLWQEGDLSQASAKLRELVDKDTELGYNGVYFQDDLDLHLAYLYEEMGELTLAQDMYEGHITELFEFFLRQHKFENAENLIASISQDENSNLSEDTLYCAMATEIFETDLSEHAFRMIQERKILETTSNENASCLVAAGNWLLSEENHTEAMTYCQWGLNLSESDSTTQRDAKRCLANTHKAKGQFTQSKTQLLQALWDNSSDSQLIEDLTSVYTSMGLTNKASCFQALSVN